MLGPQPLTLFSVGSCTTFYSVLMRPYLEFRVQSWELHFKKDKWERVQGEKTNMVRGLGNTTYKGRLEELAERTGGEKLCVRRRGLLTTFEYLPPSPLKAFQLSMPLAIFFTSHSLLPFVEPNPASIYPVSTLHMLVSILKTSTRKPTSCPLFQYSQWNYPMGWSRILKRGWVQMVRWINT